MSEINCENHKTNIDDWLFDEDGDAIHCEALGCNAHATNCVMASVNAPHDEHRHYCGGCVEVYLVGVQHGRHHEARKRKSYPGRDDSQEKPT